MKILSLTITDYGPFAGPHFFSIDAQGLVLVEGRNLDEPRMLSNGAGKSTVWDALDWCLFGEVPRREGVDSIVHDGGKTCAVVADLLDEDGRAGRITRARPARLEFVLGGQPQTAQDIAETQAQINRWLGLDREVFHAAVLFAQTDPTHFADATDAERMEILTKILPELAEVELLEAPFKAAHERAETLNRQYATDLSVLRGNLAALHGQSFAARVIEWQESQARELAQEQASLARYEALLASSWVDPSQLAAAQQEVTAAEQYRAQWGAAVQAQESDAASGVEQARATREAYSRAQAQAAAELARVTRERTRMAAVTAGRCPACGSQVTGEHLTRELARIGEEENHARALAGVAADHLAMAVQAESAATAQLQGFRAQITAQREETNQRKFAAQTRLNELLEKQKGAETTQAMVSSIRARIAKIQATANPWIQAEQERLEKVAAVQIRVDELERQKTELETNTLRYLDFWVKATGSRGLKSYILDARLQELTDAVNEWVRLLTGGTFWVRFESQKQSKSTKNIRNAPSVRVFKYLPDGRAVERGYRAFSGGEKRRISWAIDFGLSRLVARRARKSWDLMILDEVFSHVDRAGGQAIVEMLHLLRRERSSIFVIEHDAEFRSAFERVWTIQKQGGKSKLLAESEAVINDTKEIQTPTHSQSQGAQRRRGVSRQSVVRRKNPE